MSDAANHDPVAEPLSVGLRLKVLRTRRGMSREVLAGLVGRSPSWVKAVESGRLGTPKLSMLLQLAEALRVQDLAELTGNQSIPVQVFNGPGHDRLLAVRVAVNAVPITTSRPAPRIAHLRARLDRAWTARHSAPNHREVVGRLLPSLIEDAQLAVRQNEGADRRASQAVLAEVYALAQFFLAYQPAQDLLWRVAERSMIAALESDDPHVIGIAAWLMTQAHRDAGDWDAADVVTTETSRALDGRLSDGTDDILAIWGALQFESGYTAARRGELGNAWRHWDTACAVTQRLSETYYHPITSFSRAIMSAHAVTLAVELRSGGESVRQADRAQADVIPSRPRRARHHIEQARAYHLDSQPEAALRLLDAAQETASETIRYNHYARRIILEELDVRERSRREHASELARKVGLLA